MLSKRIANGKYRLSLKTTLMISMWGLVVILVSVFFILITISQVFSSLDDTAYRALSDHVESDVTRLSSELKAMSRAAGRTAENIRSKYGDAGNVTDWDSTAIDSFFKSSVLDITSCLQNVSATGAFIILDTPYTDSANMAALYIRNPDPGLYTNDIFKFSLVRGSPSLWEENAPEMDSAWLPEQPLQADLDAGFVSEPIGAVRNNRGLDAADMGYWSKPFRLSPDDIEIITFTTPLVGGNGEPFGVVGIEMSIDYLNRLIPTEDLLLPGSFHMIAMSDGFNIDMRSAFSSNDTGNRYIDDNFDSMELVSGTVTPTYHIFVPKDAGEMRFAVKSLRLYPDSSPFSGSQYYLYAASPEDELKRGSNDILARMLAAMLVSILAALFMSFYVSGVFSKRLEKLVREVRNMDPERPLEFSETNIREVGELSSVIQQMGKKILLYATRMSAIVDLVGSPIGAFEIESDQDRVFMTKSLFRLFNIQADSPDSSYIGASRFFDLLPVISEMPNDMDRMETEIEWMQDQWFQIRVRRESGSIYGTVLDISEEMAKKKFLQYERDYDPLTKLLNRNAYPEKMSAKMFAEPDKIGALIFGDLDNLKYVNDTFGHDMGDRYIQMTADAINRFSLIGGIVARISGDEFAVYMHGYENKRELRGIIDDMLGNIRSVSMRLPDGSEQHVRISVGISFYPDDANDIETLIKYSDFAMYEVKSSKKGGTREFYIESYEKNYNSRCMLNQLDFLIRSGRLKIAMQPMIDASSGLVIGYEALMRPQIREISSPAEVFVMAKSQSRLSEVEELSITMVLKWLYSHKDDLGQKLLFINTMVDRNMQESDLDSVKKLIDLSEGNIIVEMSMEECEDQAHILSKSKRVGDLGCRFAIDDAGTELFDILPSFDKLPAYVKVKMSLIRNIHLDNDRLDILRRMNEYAVSKGIKLVAKGVESYAELEAVIASGVKYVQGFYLGLPNYELDMHLNKACSEAQNLYKYHNNND